jgi:two-component system phosphate regulon sensor histidine kinase PhoR
MKKIFFKIFGGYVFLIAAISLLILAFSLSPIRNHYQETLAQELENLGRALSHDVIIYLEKNQNQELDAYLKKIGKEIHARVTVIDPQGLVLADTEKDPATMENHRYRPEVAQALEGMVGRSLRFSYTVEEQMLYVGLPLENSGRIQAVLRLSLFMKNIQGLLHSLRLTVGRTVLLMAALALIAALLFSLHLTKPIHKLTAAARQVATGNFQARVRIRNKDEFRELGESFNFMISRIAGLISDLSLQKEELSNILASIEEGLVVLDKEARVVLANEGFKKFIPTISPEGKFIWEVLRNPQVQDLVNCVRAERRNLSREIRLNDKFFFCTTSYLRLQEGMVLIFYDLSEIRKIEELKKDFIVNASHELRTPLSAILGAAEMLEDEKAGLNRMAMDILKRHAARLNFLVADLLKLSELEDKAFRLDIRDVDVKGIAESVLQIYEPKIEAKGLKSGLFADPGLPSVKADPFQIEQLLINLVDNAVRYTERGEITISLKTEAQALVIEVRDTGIGISEEQLPRVFERFYVADKSRSRPLGGTGLGLSIAKHIVQVHGGKIQVESTPEKGTTFRVFLPLTQSQI